MITIIENISISTMWFEEIRYEITVCEYHNILIYRKWEHLREYSDSEVQNVYQKQLK